MRIRAQEFLVVARLHFAVRARRDHWLDAAAFQPIAQRVAVLTFVGNEMLGRRDGTDAVLGRPVISRIAGRYREHGLAALTTGDGVDLGRAPTVAVSNNQNSRASLAPPADRCALTMPGSIINRSASSSHPASAAKMCFQGAALGLFAKRL